jgi:hypothetical protein
MLVFPSQKGYGKVKVLQGRGEAIPPLLYVLEVVE